MSPALFSLQPTAFRVFLFRVDEGLKSSAGENLNPKTWTGQRSKLVLRACLKEDVEDIASCLMEELDAAALSNGYDQESSQRISVVPLGSGVVEPSGGQGKRVFLSISDQKGGEKLGQTRADPNARRSSDWSQAVDVPLVMETLLRTALPNGFVVHHVHVASPADSPIETTRRLAKERF